jgi:LuxR family maltose regulon positive regulatory protein
MLAARSDPLLPLHRYRLAGQLHELRAADLALTHCELRDLLIKHGVTLADEDIDALLTRTEGWVAGARLSAMRMENAEHPARFVSELALGEGSIGEYLVAEVLAGQPEPVRRLLTETSPFGEVTGPLAEAVTGLDGCAGLLAELARSNSFVIPLDAARTRFRYHQLLREILRHDLRWRERDSVPTLLRRAAAYYQGTGDQRRALHWAAQAGDWTHAAALLGHGGLAHAFVHRDDVPGLGLDSWPPAPGDAAAGHAAESAVARSAVAAVLADTETAVRELARPDRPAAGPQASHELQMTADLTGLILGMKAGDADAVAAAAGQLGARIGAAPGPALPGLPAAVRLAHACTRFWHGQAKQASALLHEALAEAERTGPPVIELDVLAMITLVARFQARPRHAEAATRRAMALLHRDGGLDVPPALELAEAARLMMAADLPGAARALDRAQFPDVVGADPGLAAGRDVGQAAVLLASGDVAGAQAVAHPAAGPDLPLMRALRAAVAANAETLLGRPHTALRVLRDYQDGRFSVLAAIPHARAFLALHDVPAAQTCVRGVLSAASAQVSRYVLTEAMLCDAHIAQLTGDTERALEMTWGAIELAEDDIVLPFVAARRSFDSLLAHHPGVAARWPNSPGSGQADVVVPAARGPADGLPDPLTEREEGVLRFLATSLSPAEIAGEMCLSVNTVKTHLAAIYRKLAVRGRKGAVVRARELELL